MWIKAGGNRRKLAYGLGLLSILILGVGLNWIQQWRLDAWRRRVSNAGLYADMYVWHRFEWPSGEPLLGDLLRRQEASFDLNSEEEALKLLALGAPPVDVRIDCDPEKISERCRRELETRLKASVVLWPSAE